MHCSPNIKILAARTSSAQTGALSSPCPSAFGVLAVQPLGVSGSSFPQANISDSRRDQD